VNHGYTELGVGLLLHTEDVRHLDFEHAPSGFAMSIQEASTGRIIFDRRDHLKKASAKGE
jgi:hypothetical protein